MRMVTTDIFLATEQGGQLAEAVIADDWAAHPALNGDSWSVTGVPTGRRLPLSVAEEEAVAIVWWLAHDGIPCRTMEDAITHKDAIARICSAVLGRNVSAYR